MAVQQLKVNTIAAEQQSSALMKHATQQDYCPTDDDAEEKSHAGQYAMDSCLRLFKQDYEVEVIDNKGAKLCSHYPSQIILMGEKDNPTCQIKDRDGQGQSLKEARDELEVIMDRAAASRCRSRFVTPAIYFRGQYVCRSATLSESKELTLKMVTEAAGSAAGAVASVAGAVVAAPGSVQYMSSMFWTDGKTEKSSKGPATKEGGEGEEKAAATSSSSDPKPGPSTTAGPDDDPAQSWTRYDEYFRVKVIKDKELLNKLNVLHICDLMVEDAKVKYGMSFSSSEKADEENRYKEFNLYSFPYPGCEFFAEWNSKKRQAAGLYFNWNQAQNDAVLNVGDEGSILRQMEIDWSKQREWDLQEITQNYVQAMVRLIAQGERGLLVHCISGWDRTPLFVSLLRISLWADGLIHQSLDPAEILYLTLAYDWYLFGHRYADRKRKGEEVLPFCFYILPHISDKKFSAYNYASYPGTPSPNTPQKHSSSNGKQKRSTPKKSTPKKTSSPKQTPTGTGQSFQRVSRALKGLTPEERMSSVFAGSDHPPVLSGTSSASSPKAASSLRPRSQSPATITVSKTTVIGPSGSVLTDSPTSSLSKISLKTADSPRKRRSSEGMFDDSASSPGKKGSQRKLTMGETPRKEMEEIMKNNSPMGQDRVKPTKNRQENVDPNLSGEGVDVSGAGRQETRDPDGDETMKSREDSFEVLCGDKWADLPDRKKRLMALYYVYRSVQAKSEGVPFDEEAQRDQALEEYAYGSRIGSEFKPWAWSSLIGFYSAIHPIASMEDSAWSGAPAGEPEEKKNMEESFVILEKPDVKDQPGVVTEFGALRDTPKKDDATVEREIRDATEDTD